MKYLEDYKELHKISTVFTGSSTGAFKYRIDSLVNTTGSETLLDYGCGKALHYKDLKFDLYWGVEVELYEPAIDEYSQLQDKVYDGVICVSVLEHIPEDELEENLTNIFNRARKFVLLGIDNYPSRNKKLKSGEGVHVTLHGEDWWSKKIAPFKREDLIVDVVVMNSREWRDYHEHY